MGMNLSKQLAIDLTVSIGFGEPNLFSGEGWNRHFF